MFFQNVEIFNNINFNDVDFTIALLVKESYNKFIYNDSVLGLCLRYVANDVDTFAAVND